MNPNIRRDLRMLKVSEMNEMALSACLHWQSSEYDDAIRSASKLWGFTLAFRGIDSQLFWYGSYVHRIYGEFMVSDCQDFKAWALFRACQVFQHTSEPVESVA